MPLSYSISQVTVVVRPEPTMHGNHPQTTSQSPRRSADISHSHLHTTGFCPPLILPDDRHTKIFTAPLNPRRQPLGRYLAATLPVRQSQLNSGILPTHTGQSDHTRPETHQNLIHTDKEQCSHSSEQPATQQSNTEEPLFLTHRITDFGHSAIHYSQRSQQPLLTRGHGSQHLLRKRLPPCEAGAGRRWAQVAPQHTVRVANGGGGDDRDRTDDPLLAKQVLSQLSYAPIRNQPILQSIIIGVPSPGLKHQWSIVTDPHWWAREDLNLRPHAYQACALTS